MYTKIREFSGGSVVQRVKTKKGCRKLNVTQVTQVTHIQSMEFVGQQRERGGEGDVGDLHSTGRER